MYARRTLGPTVADNRRPAVPTVGGPVSAHRSIAPRTSEFVQRVVDSPGATLDAETHAFMKARLGHDFSKVRVHAGPDAGVAARAVRAVAFALGDHIVFDDGRYQPKDRIGATLLAHELAHTVGAASASTPSSMLPPDHPLERIADQAARAASLRSREVVVPTLRVAGTVIRRQPFPAAPATAGGARSFGGHAGGRPPFEVRGNRIRLYRAVSPAEANALIRSGYFEWAPSGGGKYFAFTEADARAFAQAIGEADATIVRATVPIAFIPTETGVPETISQPHIGARGGKASLVQGETYLFYDPRGGGWSLHVDDEALLILNAQGGRPEILESPLPAVGGGLPAVGGGSRVSAAGVAKTASETAAVHIRPRGLFRGLLRALNIVDLALLAMQFLLEPLKQDLAETNEQVLATLWTASVGSVMEEKAAVAMQGWWRNPIEDPAVRGEEAWISARWRVVMEKENRNVQDVVAAVAGLEWPQTAAAVELDDVWIEPQPTIAGPVRAPIQRERGGRSEVVYTVQGSFLIADPLVSRYLYESRARRASGMRWHGDLAAGLIERGLRTGMGADWDLELFFALAGRDYYGAAEALERGMDALGDSDKRVWSYLREFHAAMLDFREQETEESRFDASQRALLKALRALPEEDPLDLTMPLDTEL
jgi:hypothetical protein